MGLLTNKRLIMVKAESEYGTDPVPSADSDALLVRDNINLTPLNLQYADRSIVRAFLGASDQLPTNAHAVLELEVEVTGMQGLGVPTPPLSALLQACALAETDDEGTDVVYNPVSGDFESCAIYVNQDGVLQRLTGCRGTAKLVLRNHEVPFWQVQVFGRYNALTDAAQGSPDYSAFKVPLPVNNTNTTGFKLHGFEAGVLQNLEIDLANNVIYRSLVGASDECMITGRRAVGALSMEMTTVNAKDWIGIARSGATGALEITHGSAGNQLTVECPRVQLTNPRYEDSEGIVMLSLDLVVMPDEGNDEVVFTFA